MTVFSTGQPSQAIYFTMVKTVIVFVLISPED